MAVFRDDTITGKRIVVDENLLDNCTLIDCELVYRGGDVTVNFEAKNCRWKFEGAAAATIAVLHAIGVIPPGLVADEALSAKPENVN